MSANGHIGLAGVRVSAQQSFSASAPLHRRADECVVGWLFNSISGFYLL